MRFKTVVPAFNAQQLEALARILGDTADGLTGPEIGRLLQQCEIEDVAPDMTKWKRLFNAFVTFQNQHHCGNHVIVFINHALNPAAHLRSPGVFEQWRSDLNVVLSLAGMSVGDDGKVRRAQKTTTLSEALERANRFKAKIERRGVHTDVLKYCATEIASENYFHAVFESMKSLSSKVRSLSGLDGDGADLFERAFSFSKDKNPVLAINDLRSETLRGEQRGFLNLLKGLFGTIRNPIGHEAKIEWEMSEQDALDILTAVSLIHRKLDKATRTTQ